MAADPFTCVWCTRRVPRTEVAGRHARVDANLDGITFTVSERRARRYGIPRVRLVGWHEVLGASLRLSRKGRPVVRVAVVDEPSIPRHQDDPFAVKLPRRDLQSARELVQYVNSEVDVRRQWQEFR